jgi:predicted RNase H-like HicB family nuclease
MRVERYFMSIVIFAFLSIALLCSRAYTFSKPTERESMRYTVILEPEAEGGFHVGYPALKGCHSQGDTKEEAVANIQEAVALYVESLQKEGKRRA